MRIATRTKVNTLLRDEWPQAIDVLCQQIKQWVYQEPEWTFKEAETSKIEELHLGKCTVPAWSIVTPEGEARLEPIARNFPGRGIVELYAWPTLRRVRLLSDDGEWKVRVDSGFNLRQPWDREHFVLLVRDLIGVDYLAAAN